MTTRQFVNKVKEYMTLQAKVAKETSSIRRESLKREVQTCEAQLRKFIPEVEAICDQQEQQKTLF